MDYNGLAFICLIIGAGSAFIGVLFGMTAEIYEDKTDKGISTVSFIITAICIVIMVIAKYKEARYVEENGIDMYTLRLYYLGGSQSTKTFYTDTRDYPYIHSYRGSYTLKGVYNSEQGVVRFEVLSKKNISCEEYDKEYR